jgi:hypothetical protein
MAFLDANGRKSQPRLFSILGLSSGTHPESEGLPQYHLHSSAMLRSIGARCAGSAPPDDVRRFFEGEKMMWGEVK